jgi:tripartite-type tricarboxylate transporter receptor subunit TctC
MAHLMRIHAGVPPLPARGERVGVRGRFHKSEPARSSPDAQTRGEAPSPGSLAQSDLSPHAGRGGAGRTQSTTAASAQWSRLFRSARLLAISLVTVVALAPAAADDYPARPITLIVPFAPGGSTTIVARIIADRMAETLGQQIIVDNRPGAGGTVGTRQVAKSAPDGYTLVLGYTGTLAIGPSLFPNVGYDVRKDFAPIGRIASAPNTLAVHPSFNVHSVPELIAYAKANPGKVNYGSAGVGTVGHVGGELLATRAGTSSPTFPIREPGRR